MPASISSCLCHLENSYSCSVLSEYMYYTNGYDRENERQVKSDEEAIGDKTMIGLVFILGC
jgi:hypothetical protein